QANPPQLHSKLLYIQRYRRQSRLVGEAAYFFTNMMSAESFISNIDAKSISMEEAEYKKNMELARVLISAPSNEDGREGNTRYQAQSLEKDKESLVQPRTAEGRSRIKDLKDETSMAKVPSLLDIENKGAALLLKEADSCQVFRDYPYLFANVGDLTINNVEELLNSYKELVFKYVCVCKGWGGVGPSDPLPNNQDQDVEQKSSVQSGKNDEETEVVEESNEGSIENVATS
ncbi:Vacuolar protein sorting-associated protein 9A, partial [Linum grandiflorum]